MEHLHSKIALIGSGNVGATTAYALMISGLTREIAIVDINTKKTTGEVLDLNHGASFINPVSVYQADYKLACENADVIVITAGAAQKPGQTRLDLIRTNIKIFASIISEIVKYSDSDAILLVVTNPVDVLSYITYKMSGFPSKQVIGSGTVLDTSRLRFLLSETFNGINPKNIHAYIIGEHGDSGFVAWSNAQIAGISLKQYLNSTTSRTHNSYNNIDKTLESIYVEVKNSAYKIIEAKGATYYAIGLSIVSILKAIIRDEKNIMPISTLINDYYDIDDLYLSLPSLIGKQGVEYFIKLTLSEHEQKLLRNSALVIKNILKEQQF